MRQGLLRALDRRRQFERATETHHAAVRGLVRGATRYLPVAVIIVSNKQDRVAILDNRPRTVAAVLGGSSKGHSVAEKLCG
jgi:hypothetical protein